MKDNTKERNPMNAKNVVQVSVVTEFSKYMKKITRERNPVSARNVGKPSPVTKA